MEKIFLENGVLKLVSCKILKRQKPKDTKKAKKIFKIPPEKRIRRLDLNPETLVHVYELKSGKAILQEVFKAIPFDNNYLSIGQAMGFCHSFKECLSQEGQTFFLVKKNKRKSNEKEQLIVFCVHRSGDKILSEERTLDDIRPLFGTDHHRFVVPAPHNNL